METTRLDKAIIALHDHGTREGATTNRVIDGMKKDGFSTKEIAQAALEMATP